MVRLDDAREVRRLRCADRGRLRDERCHGADLKRRVEPPLEADRRRGLRAHRLAAERAGDVTREDLDAVGELEQAVERVVEPLGALGCTDGEVGPGGVADEERVAGQHEPGLIAARGVDDGQAAVLGPVAGRVDHAQGDGADLDRVAVDHRIVRVVDLGRRVDADRNAVLEREAAVPGDVVGVRVRLDRSHDPEPAPLGLGEQRLDRKRRVDEHGDAGFFVSHEVTRAAEIAVQELVEDHGATVAPGPAIALEVSAAGRSRGRRRSRARRRRPRRWRPRGAPSAPPRPRRGARSDRRSTSPCGCRCRPG